MSKDSIKYFNFPVQLMAGFLKDSIECLDSILCCCIYEKAQKEKYSIKEAADYFNVNIQTSEDRIAKKGRKIFENLPKNPPKVGMELTQFWDFYKNHKSEFEKVCFLAFLALKSILGDKSYCIITNSYWLSRMDGKSKAVKEFDELSTEIRKYSDRYWTNKIKTELKLKWYLIAYSHYMRGFAVTFKMPFEDLVFQVEKNRKSSRIEQLKKDEKAARMRAIERLNARNNNDQGRELKQHHNNTYKKGRSN
jgi:hypothetical protein